MISGVLQKPTIHFILYTIAVDHFIYYKSFFFFQLLSPRTSPPSLFRIELKKNKSRCLKRWVVVSFLQLRLSATKRQLFLLSALPFPPLACDWIHCPIIRQHQINTMLYSCNQQESCPFLRCPFSPAAADFFFLTPPLLHRRLTHSSRQTNSSCCYSPS